MDGGTRYQGHGLPPAEPGEQWPQVFNVQCKCEQCLHDMAETKAARRLELETILAKPDTGSVEERMDKLGAAWEMHLLEDRPSPFTDRVPLVPNPGDVVVCPHGNGTSALPVRDPDNGKYNWVV